MFNIPALQDVCVPCIIDGEWRWKGVESGDNWPQFPHWPVVPVVPVVPGESDAGCWTADDVCLLAFTLSSPPPASARHVSLSTPDRETMQVPQFWHRHTSIFTIFRILRAPSLLLIRPSIWRRFADNYLKFRRKDYVQKTFENSALWYLEVWSAMLSTRKRCKEAFSEYRSTLCIAVTFGEL